MRIGVVVNPSAGQGHSLPSVISRLEDAWGGHTLMSVAGPAAACFRKASLLPEPDGGYVEKIQGGVNALLKEGAQLLVTLGGDGTAAYAAEAVIASGTRTPLLGVGLGTANVGPIVTLTAADPLPPVDALVFQPVGSIAVFSGGRRTAAGFNDVVLGNTYLATMDGETVTADGAALLEKGVVIPARPLANALTDRTRILKNGRPLPHSLREAGQIIASVLERDPLYGRAVHGVFCCAPGSPALGALTLSARPLVSYEPDDRGFDAFAPEERLLFSAEEEITITDLAPSVLAVCDGNPYRIDPSAVILRYIPQEILVAKRR